MSQLASADTPRLGERTATHIDQPLKKDLSQLQTTNPTPCDLCRRTAREDCLITSREKLQFFVAQEQLAAGVAARGLEPRPTGRWQALLQGVPAGAIDMAQTARLRSSNSMLGCGPTTPQD